MIINNLIRKKDLKKYYYKKHRTKKFKNNK